MRLNTPNYSDSSEYTVQFSTKGGVAKTPSYQEVEEEE